LGAMSTAGTGIADDAPLFPFVISYDAPDNATNVGGWLERPAGKHGFVRAEGGRLATDAGPIRFWGTNLCFDACFPSHEQAERVAARLARLGINCVRMHHMDSHSIWGNGPNKLTIDPERLERLDYLIYQLKLHGVYTDLNLHVSRWFGAADGFVAQNERPQYDKGLDNFEPRMIDLQKRYARDLLTHVNPYTRNPYTDEPAVAMVEINNENALFAVWGWNQIDRLAEPYATTFRRLWNAWLRKKYGDTAALRKAWNVGTRPLGGEMLRNGDFQKPLDETWNLERDARTEVAWSLVRVGPDSGRCLRVVVTRQGDVSWHPQFTQSGFAVKKGEAYRLTCWLRADAKRRIDVNCMMAHPPWRQIGLATEVDVGPEWKREELAFVASEDDANARITVSGLEPGTYEFDEVSLRPGGLVGLGENERIEDDTVAVLRHGRSSMTEATRRDFVDFLWDTEQAYWQGMHRFLKDELGVKSPVSGTQLSYSPTSIQAELDYIDAHAYWNHPDFPGRPWDANNWTVTNTALVNHPGGTLADLASRRVASKAFTVSEYNHPAPNEYAAEGFGMIAAFGAFQRWDGIFSFAYCHNDRFEPQRIEGFFDIKSDTARLAHMPACAALFLRRDAAEAKQVLTAPVPIAAQRETLYRTLDPWSLTTGRFGVDPDSSLVDAIAMDLVARGPAPQRPASETERVFVSDTGQLRWDVSRPGAGYFMADTPRTKLWTGFVAGREFTLGGVTLKIGRTRLDWATVSIVAIDGEGFDRPGRVLIAATGVVHNQDARLERLDDDRVTLGDRWGGEPVLCEGIPAEITLPVPAERVTLYPLDPSGNRREPIAVNGDKGKAVLPLAPGHKTVWYEAVIR
jgi:hypothetical protein